MRQRKWNPRHLVLAVLLGAMLGGGGSFVTYFLPWGRGDTRHRLALYGPILCGIVMSFLAGKKLSTIVRNSLSPDEEFAAARVLLAKAVWTWSAGAVFAMGVLLCVCTHHGWLILNIAFYPLSALSSTRRLLPPRGNARHEPPGLCILDASRDLAPLRSNFWGQAREDTSLPSRRD